MTSAWFSSGANSGRRPPSLLLDFLVLQPLEAYLRRAVGQQGAEAKLRRVCESAIIWVRMFQQVAPLCALWITLIKLWRERARLGLDAAAYSPRAHSYAAASNERELECPQILLLSNAVNKELVRRSCRGRDSRPLSGGRRAYGLPPRSGDEP